jgi:putative transposase
VLQLQAFRYQLRPNGGQERSLRRFAGSRRFAYNRALALQKDRRAKGEKTLGYAALCKELTAWRGSEETPWLADAPIHPLQQSCSVPAGKKGVSPGTGDCLLFDTRPV